MSRTTAQRLVASVRGARRGAATQPDPAAPARPRRRAAASAEPASAAQPPTAPSGAAVDAAPAPSAQELFPRRVWPD